MNEQVHWGWESQRASKETGEQLFRASSTSILPVSPSHNAKGTAFNKIRAEIESHTREEQNRDFPVRRRPILRIYQKQTSRWYSSHFKDIFDMHHSFLTRQRGQKDFDFLAPETHCPTPSDQHWEYQIVHRERVLIARKWLKPGRVIWKLHHVSAQFFWSKPAQVGLPCLVDSEWLQSICVRRKYFKLG